MPGPPPPPAPTATSTSTSSSTSRPRTRRPRTARACDACRAKKNRCDDVYPCSYCRRHGIECLTMGRPPLGTRHADDSYVKGLEEQVRLLKSLQDSSPSAASSHHSASVPPRASPAASHGRGTQPEVSAVNAHTDNVEFYGSSSAVALLSHVERAGASGCADDNAEGDGGSAASDHDGPAIVTTHGRGVDSIVSDLHNPAFSPASHELDQRHQRPSPRTITTSAGTDRATATSSLAKTVLLHRDHPQCRVFVLNFFASIHHIHPILSKAAFLARCDEIAQQGTGSGTVTSFDALYCAVLSLGALVGPREEEPLEGRSNLQWSRLFFDEAVRRRHELGMVTDLAMVQCYFILAKVCQNELNPHLAYMYIGLAVRTALAMGINREPRNRSSKNKDQLKAETRTWWGLYSLEVEMSFSMGRPDTLGADLYHNRHFPLLESDLGKDEATSPDLESLEPPHCAIIKIMVDLSRIIKSIGLDIYLSDQITLRTVELAFRLQAELDQWAETVPLEIRPRANPRDLVSLKSAKDAQWIKRQRLVLTLRYLNLRILIFGSLLLPSSSAPPGEDYNTPIMHSQDAQRGIRMCVDSARSTIDIIFMMYQHHDFFRTWFYNTTYVSFAASILLVYVTKSMTTLTEAQVVDLLQVVGQAIEVLETMDESIVALKSAKLLRRAMERARKTKLSRSARGADMEDAHTARPRHMSAASAYSMAPSSVLAPMADPHAGSTHDAGPGSHVGIPYTNHNTGGMHDGYGADITMNGFDGSDSRLDAVSSESDLFLNHYWGPLNFFDADNMAMPEFYPFQLDQFGGAGEVGPAT